MPSARTAVRPDTYRLNELRERLLNPPEWVDRIPEVVPGYLDRIIPKPEHAADLKKRTFVLERQFTTSVLAELTVTPDGHVLARPEGEPGPLAHIAAEADLRANLRRLGIAAGLDDAEWSEYADLVSQRLGIDLQERGES